MLTRPDPDPLWQVLTQAPIDEALAKKLLSDYLSNTKKSFGDLVYTDDYYNNQAFNRLFDFLATQSITDQPQHLDALAWLETRRRGFLFRSYALGVFFTALAPNLSAYHAATSSKHAPPRMPQLTQDDPACVPALQAALRAENITLVRDLVRTNPKQIDDAISHAKGDDHLHHLPPPFMQKLVEIYLDQWGVDLSSISPGKISELNRHHERLSRILSAISNNKNVHGRSAFVDPRDLLSIAAHIYPKSFSDQTIRSAIDQWVEGLKKSEDDKENIKRALHQFSISVCATLANQNPSMKVSVAPIPAQGLDLFYDHLKNNLKNVNFSNIPASDFHAVRNLLFVCANIQNILSPYWSKIDLLDQVNSSISKKDSKRANKL